MAGAAYTAELQHNALFQRRRSGGTAAVLASRQQRLETLIRALDFLESAGKAVGCNAPVQRLAVQLTPHHIACHDTVPRTARPTESCHVRRSGLRTNARSLVPRR